MTLCHISVCDLFPVLPVHSHNSLPVCLHQAANCKLDLLVVHKFTWDKDDITLAVYINLSVEQGILIITQDKLFQT
jgi:hypothetical protein